MDKRYIKVNGQWTAYDRAIEKQGQTIDILLTVKRDTQAALRFLKKAINENRKPSLVNIDQSGANKADMNLCNQDNKIGITIHQCTYLKNTIEQGHQRIMRLTRPTMGFKNFHATERTLVGLEVMAMFKKDQRKRLVGN